MDFNRHLHLEGKHAYLSASKYHWVRYSEEKLIDNFLNIQSVRRGTELHELASDLIRLGVKLPNNKQTLNSYVNDAIGFRMTPEQTLVYSDNAFGTADAISFRKNKLRIHDLKTGINKASIEQLEIYSAFFCLEYGFKPFDIEMELRIYQNDEIIVHDPERDTIFHIMDRIITFDKLIERIKQES
ncbi:exonuclease [Gordonia phage Secretariat]|uniref:Cas4 family exonuclease n=1 Tax=Gordonia phage Secretariat TaxID=2725616 RepID=A0A6M3SVC0_9CAUD|nr:exonuclease [Gordonia phage Secretariat]QJD49657.1 Cas4 family exonuclease [Gordonia phage Secretariat]